MSLLRRGNRRHGIGDFAEKRSQGVLLRASFLHVFAHSRLLSAYFAEQLQRDVFRFISHGVIMPSRKLSRKPRRRSARTPCTGSAVVTALDIQSRRGGSTPVSVNLI